jgi:N-acetylneuraminic acid mutarotase
VTTTGGRILLLGGLTRSDTSTAAIVQTDPTTGASASVGALAQAVHDAAATTVGSRATVFGGGSARTSDAVQAFSGATAHVIGRLPQPRSDLTAATVGSTSYIVGGFDGRALVPDVDATNDGVHFRVIGRLLEGVRYPAVAAVGSDIWVIGGQRGTAEGANGTEVDVIQRIDSKSGAVTVAGHMPQPLAHAMAFSLGDRLYVAGGRTTTGPVDTIWAVAPDGAVTNAGRLPSRRSDAGIAVLGSTAWLLGGEISGPTTALASVIAVSATG